MFSLNMLSGLMQFATGVLRKGCVYVCIFIWLCTFRHVYKSYAKVSMRSGKTS